MAKEQLIDRRNFLNRSLQVALLGLATACTPRVTSAPVPLSTPEIVSTTAAPINSKEGETLPGMIKSPWDLPYTDEERNYYESHAKIVNSLFKRSLTDEAYKGVVAPELVIIDRIVNDKIKKDPSLGTWMMYEYDMYLYLGMGRNQINHNLGASWLPESIKYMFWDVNIRINDPELQKIYGEEANFLLDIETWYKNPIQKDLSGNEITKYALILSDYRSSFGDEHNLIPENLLTDVAAKMIRVPKSLNWQEDPAWNIERENRHEKNLQFPNPDGGIARAHITSNGGISYEVDFNKT